MNWSGQTLKSLCDGRSLSISALAKQLEVSRQTIHDWINGQVPRGNHLLALCEILGVEPDALFESSEPFVLVPAHRTRKNAKVNSKRHQQAVDLAAEYEVLCAEARVPIMQPVVRSAGYDDVEPLAKCFRGLVGLADSPDPMDDDHVFKLMEVLGICVIFRTFPKDLPDYAFYVRIRGHRVVFVNLQNNVLDLIFPIIHEAVHAVRDEETPAGEYDEKEESFCDAVANAVQFPSEYVAKISQNLKGLPAGYQVNLLKTEAALHHHAICGLVKCIEKDMPLDLNIHGADSNLHKQFPTLQQVLDRDGGSPEHYLARLKLLSPLFYRALQENISSLSERKLTELLELPSVFDAQRVRELLEREGGVVACTSSATPAAS